MKNILAICGSLRAESANLTILQNIKEMLADRIDIEFYEDLADLPHFNPDLDAETPSAKVTNFRRKIKSSDGVLICSPEYVFSAPAALKNALEWTVSGAVFTKSRRL